jgi:hypothetical protein
MMTLTVTVVLGAIAFKAVIEKGVNHAKERFTNTKVVGDQKDAACGEAKNCFKSSGLE